MKSGIRVRWATAMGSMIGTTISDQTADGHILVALDSVDNLCSVFYLLVANLTQI
jgi:hypothetical protein